MSLRWSTRVAARLLRRHVRRRAKHHARIRPWHVKTCGWRLRGGVLDELGEAEIDNLGVTVLGDHDVGRLQIAVDDALLVSTGQALGDLGRKRERTTLR